MGYPPISEMREDRASGEVWAMDPSGIARRTLDDGREMSEPEGEDDMVCLVSHILRKEIEGRGTRALRQGKRVRYKVAKLV